MTYARHLRWEGLGSVVLGLALMAAALLLADWPLRDGALVAVVACVLVAALGRFRAPGAWFTERPLRTVAAEPGVALDLRARLVAESAVWVVLVVAWLAWRGESGALVFGTGAASVLFGWAQAVPGRARALREAPDAVVVERPAIGTPRLSTQAGVRS